MARATEDPMSGEKARGVGAVLVALGVVCFVLWLAVARLSPETAFGVIGLLVGFATGLAIAVGAAMVRKNR